MPKQLRLPFIAFALLLVTTSLFGQQPLSGSTTISQYVLFADGSHRGMFDSTRYGVQMGDFSGVTRGVRDSTFIGSNFRVGIGSFNTIVSNIYSGNRVNIVSDNTIGGNIVARNDAFANFDVVTIGSSRNRIGSYDPFNGLGLAPNGGIIQARGNVRASVGDSIKGPVYLQKPYTYSGPPPFLGPPQILDTLPLPTLPSLPFQTTFPAFGGKDVGISDSILPGAYRDMILTGGGTVTLLQPGVYVFKSIKSFGKNNINFLIPPDSTQNYRIYVHEDVDLGPTQVTINGQGPDGNDNFILARQIYMEVHGNGSTVPGGNAFHIKDTSRGPEISSFWAGTVYATNGSIAIGTVGALEGYEAIVHGAFWSKTKILIGDNVK
ncbi:MAG TPA: hypothetical protein VFT06_05530, partial [Flavisolibacter sp.]|nr:hypothetical protein [Flavisolibacter sp.]